MEPLVSVIVPVYNVLPYLREALDSVINQTYRNLEILIVDDGSTDGSGEVCDEYLSDPRVIVIHQENKGLSGARNTGLDRMAGEYVAFLDSDDAFMPEMIERMVNAIIQNKVDMAVCGFFTCQTEKAMNTSGIRKTENVCFDEEKVLSSVEAQNMLIADKICWVVWNKLYKCVAWENIRFPEGSNFEDMRVMCRVLEICKQIITVPGFQIYYRKRTGSITQTQTEKNVHDRLLAIISVEDYIREHTYIIFPPDSLYSFQQRYARFLCDLYARLLIHPHSAESKAAFRKEILFYWTRLKGTPYHFQSRISHFLFLYAPVLLLPARSCWRTGKQLFEKAHT